MSNFISIFSCLLLILVFPKQVLGDCSHIWYCLECEGIKCTKCLPHYTTEPNQNNCFICDNSCSECIKGKDNSRCTSCNGQHYLEYNNGLGYGHCLPCRSDLCEVCEENSTGYYCTKCKSGYFLDDNNDCQLCSERCDTCTEYGEAKCLTCKGGFYDPTNSKGEHKCETCTDLCKKCHGPNIEDCEICKDGYYLTNNQCLECKSPCATCIEKDDHCTSCNDGFYLDGNSCLKCSDSCKTCKGEGDFNCTECNEGFALADNYCKSCLNEGCRTCISVNNVLRCINGCLPGYRIADYDNDNDETTIKCEKCKDACSNCDDSPTTCKSCYDGFVLIDEHCLSCSSPCKTCHDTQDTCDSCVEGYYFNGSSCQNCPDNCLQCDKTGQKCSLCIDTFYVENDACVSCDVSCQKCHDNTNECDICKRGYYFEGTHCVKCSQNCLNCDETQCYECEKNFYPVGKTCSACAEVCEQCDGPTADDCRSCDPGYYLSWYKGQISCLKCDDACETCYSSPSNCDKCAQGYFREESSRKCTSCEFNCLECDDLRECKKCKDGFRLYQREGESDHDCQPCKDRGCKTCDSSATECTECIDGFYQTSIQGTNFVTCSKCPSGCKKCDKSKCTECYEGYYNNNGVCKECSAPCATCESENKCLSCVNGYLFKDGLCKDPCNSNCLTCEGNPETCTSCHNGFGLKGTKCETCMPNCRICEYDWQDNMECKSCLNGYYLAEDGNCSKCSESCKTCVSHEVCSSCADGYYFTSMNYEPGTYYTGTCSKCNGPGHEKCELCIENCNDDDTFTCSEMPICTKCTDGYYVDSESKCQQCESPCATCTAAGNQSCTSCIEGYTLKGTICSIPEKCEDNTHCDFDNSDGTEYKEFTEPLPAEFNSISNQGSGGAIKLTNYAFKGSNSSFTKCESINGGGGAIFIYNNIKPEEENSIEVSLTNLVFTECKANYGAAVFIYSEYNPVNINSCTFKKNQLTASSGHQGFAGGSALYLTIKTGQILDCSFEANKGAGGAVKISDNFDIKPSTLRMLQKTKTNSTQSSILISGCTFEIEENSDSSLYYALSKRSIKVDVNKCTFKGKLASDAHHIDGMVIGKEMPNLAIKSCHFSANQNSALNRKFLKVDLGDQVLASKKENKQLSMTIILELSIVAVTTALIIAFYKKVNGNNENSANTENSVSNDTHEA